MKSQTDRTFIINTSYIIHHRRYIIYLPYLLNYFTVYYIHTVLKRLHSYLPGTLYSIQKVLLRYPLPNSRIDFFFNQIESKIV